MILLSLRAAFVLVCYSGLSVLLLSLCATFVFVHVSALCVPLLHLFPPLVFASYRNLSSIETTHQIKTEGRRHEASASVFFRADVGLHGNS